MLLSIKNMVCDRCRMVVQAELEKLNLRPISITLGEVMIAEAELDAQQTEQLRNAISKLGFELIDDRNAKLIERIKTIIIEEVHYANERTRKKLSTVLTDRLHHDYSYLSHLFSESGNITIEQFAIQQKIERVKELLMYDEMSLAQIAFELDYSSAAHLSNQFKKQTGLTPSAYRQQQPQRHPLDAVGKRK